MRVAMLTLGPTSRRLHSCVDVGGIHHLRKPIIIASEYVIRKLTLGPSNKRLHSGAQSATVNSPVVGTSKQLRKSLCVLFVARSLSLPAGTFKSSSQIHNRSETPLTLPPSEPAGARVQGLGSRIDTAPSKLAGAGLTRKRFLCSGVGEHHVVVSNRKS